MAEATDPVFQIQRIYLKDLSLEQPNSPAILLSQEAPSVDIQIGLGSEQIGDGVFEDFLPGHPELACGLGCRHTAIDIEQLIMRAIGMKFGGKDAARLVAGFLASFEHDSSRPVSEQHAGRPVFPIENARKSL